MPKGAHLQHPILLLPLRQAGYWYREPNDVPRLVTVSHLRVAGVIHETPCQKLAIVVVDHLLTKDLAKALSNAAVNLSLNYRFLEYVPYVIDSVVADDCQKASFRINFDFADVAAIWETHLRRDKFVCGIQTGIYETRCE